MMMDLVVGLLVTAVPALAVGYLMLKKQPAIFRMFIVMVLVGLGYLTMTGAIEDIGAMMQGKAAPTPVAAPAPAPAAEAPKSEAPAATEPAASEPAPAPAAEETQTESAPAPESETTTAPAASEAQPNAATSAPEAAQPPASTQVDTDPGATKPAP